MLDIHQGFYQNIGPLKNKSLLANYKNAKVLIKAPIGTGKSFLFFDGPIFALYKSSDRTIINKDSKKGEIQLLFSVNGNFYLIVRKLTQTKSGSDSVKTHFYSILKDKNFIDYLDDYKNENIILKNNDILTLLNFFQVKLEDLTSSFKQEKELQENLNELLPPKEVVLSTSFLQQNSENIFEIRSSERINILKQVFGIMGIDEAKKRVDEKKREIYGIIKSKENTDEYRQKLKTILNSFTSILRNISSSYFSEKSQKELVKIYSFVEDLENVDSDINLDKFNILDFDIDLLLDENREYANSILRQNEQANAILENIQKIEQEILENTNKIKSINENIQKIESLEKKEEGLKLEIKTYKVKQDSIRTSLSTITGKYTDLQKEYENYLMLVSSVKSKKQEFNNLQKSIENIENNIKSKKQDKNNFKKTDEIKKIETTIQQKNKEIQEIENMDLSSFDFEDKKVNSLKELENLLNEIKTNGVNLANTEKDLKQDKISLEKELEDLKKSVNKKVDFTFNCEKINANCPFIEKIVLKLEGKEDFLKKQIAKTELKLSSTDKKLSEIQEKLNYLRKYWKEKNIALVQKKLDKYEALNDEIKQLHNNLQKLQKQAQQIASLDGQIQQLENEKKQNLEKLELLKKEIKNIEKNINPAVLEDYKLYQLKQKELLALNEKLSDLNMELEKIQNFKTKTNEDKVLLKQLEQYNKKLEDKKEKETKKLEKYKKQLEGTKLEHIQQQARNLQNLKETILLFNNLLEDYNKNKLSLLEYKQKYALLKDLSNIFGKELVIYVFSDYLQALQDLINYFIQDVVNFSLVISLDEKGENLDIYVQDEKGKRPVSSLSGGQKTALRIAWILGISKMQNSKILFLDETINNFDQESVHIIASKIKDFTQENDIKFYMITHSEILQQIDIWTEVLELSLD